MTGHDAHTKYLAGFVNEMALQGLTDAVISPGSRSTPLAILLAEHPSVQTHLQIDERSAAFYALGMAKKLRRPIVLLCTSGTAAANYFPAVIEASLSNVPLVVLTADRPHELRDVGAPQAINQNEMYGSYVKWFADAAVPEDTPFMRRYARTLASRSYGEAAAVPMGPVHLNFPLREPLIPDLSLPSLWGRQEKQTYKGQAAAVADPHEAEKLAGIIRSSERGLLVCGELHDPEFKEAVMELSKASGFPILADPLSNLRTGSGSKEEIIEHYDSILKNEELRDHLRPDLVIRFGAVPVSKPLFVMLRDEEEIYQVIVDQNGKWRDPALAAAEIFPVNEAQLCRQLAESIRSSKNADFAEEWKLANRIFRDRVADIEEGADLFEGKVFMELSHLMPEDSQMFVGNSMPIRDADTYFGTTEKQVSIYANRGANGIDGVVSSSLGIAAASKQPTVLVIGDLSMYHDLNGLLGAKLNGVSMTIVLLNNDGGGIFSFLPQSAEEKHFEYLFGTPAGLDYRKAAELYQTSYFKAESWESFRKCFTEYAGSEGVQIIEVPTNRHTRVKIHRELLESVSREIIGELLNEKRD
ncbi:2-succinyl-5-enolpyruvyl-6-hydroxy-3-cyclohexene-1-carboxylic-acid synthase [Bacillus mangrovi]|uniref:2-succinyl-5-enolpyruvyl-6-hydroxy-3-cyclohexene-1-carboxylate synthase n=1 Tax=Metabacillus mangrovi TaxID=1491830 RepID=A0A7X2V5F9_9BACI|nr:2-succinyl-5-enolpyruvyl-6-hydroxy-3-cyclohexene-1-carboxylic-acid synthase [Metabacillus mangrovi]MTH54405.1 2-succinyl-5-enolpyruvyl-6-hydroxy-3-cyclohexene-1-carboxylic-acid synthase [Metabacillus mangrovi]